MIHHGTTRNVLLIGRWAIKTPTMRSCLLWHSGCVANIQERLLWHGYRDHRLAPVRWGDPFGLVLVMDRADKVFDDGSDREDLDKFLKECSEAFLPVDPKYSNIGKFGDTLKLIDYGSL